MPQLADRTPAAPRPTWVPATSGEVVRQVTLAIVLFVVLVALATTRADVDLWGHVLFGLDILRDRQISAVDPYSFTTDRRWINHEWLSEVVFAIAWLAGGPTGLIAVKVACAIAALACVSRALRIQGVAAPARIPLLGLALAGILPRITHIRPQLFSVFLFAALMLAFVKSERGSVKHLLWSIPILAFWTNLHGGWIVGLGTVGLWAMGQMWERRHAPTAAMLAAFCLASALATLVNPYGIGLWTFLLETVRFGREAIDEWGPIWTYPPVLLLWIVFTTMLAAALWTRRVPPLSARALVAIAWCVASVRVSRLDSFFALTVLVLIGPRLARFFGSPREASRRPAYGLVAAVVGALLLATPARRVVTCVTVHAPWWPEPESVAFMRDRALAGEVVTFFRWGEYGIWHLPRSLKISMDGRRETIYTDETVANHVSLYRGGADGLAYLERLDADYVWFPRQLPVVPVLQASGWVPIFTGPQSILLERADRRPGAAAPATAPLHLPADRCFPGP